MQKASNGMQPVGAIGAILSEAQKIQKELEIKKERLKQKILFEWSQARSKVFWDQCFIALDYKVILVTFTNIKKMIDGGYAVANPAALFVHTLKKTGYFPFQQEAKNNEG